MTEGIKRATFISKESNELPKGAKILKKEVTIEVEEIENGFLTVKRLEYKYKVGENIDWKYITTKSYSKDNPATQKSTKDTFLADLFG